MSSYFFIKEHSRCVKVSTDDIMYIERDRDCIKICTDERKWTVPFTIKEIERELPAGFCRVHRSYIVAIQRITSFDKSNVYLADETIPLGDEYRDSLMEKIMLYLDMPSTQ